MVKRSHPERTFAVFYLDGVPVRLLKITNISENYEVNGGDYEVVGALAAPFVPALSMVKIEGWARCTQSPASIQEHIDKHTEKPCTTTK